MENWEKQQLLHIRYYQKVQFLLKGKEDGHEKRKKVVVPLSPNLYTWMYVFETSSARDGCVKSPLSFAFPSACSNTSMHI